MPQIPATFSCPHCRTPLRLRQRPGGTIRLPCPDCAAPLELSDQAGELLVRPADPAEPRGPAPPTLSRQPRRERPAVRFATLPLPAFKRAGAVVMRGASDPLVVTWITAGATTVLIAVAFFRGGSDPSRPITERNDPADVALASSEVPAALPIDVPRSVPLDEAVSGVEPTATDPGSRADALVEPPPPVAAPKPPNSPPVDPRRAIQARLEQRILRFDQPTPVGFDVLRLQLEELAGVAIRYDEAAQADPRFRSAQVQVSIAEATLVAVLAEVAGQAGLEHRVEAAGVLLTPAGTQSPEQAAVTDSTGAP